MFTGDDERNIGHLSKRPSIVLDSSLPTRYDTESQEENPLGSKIFAGRTALQTQGLTISWHHISVEVKTKVDKNGGEVTVMKLLQDVSGNAKPGELLAIMGASGAGKTTLLDILTGRSLENLDVQGEVRVNGHNLGQAITGISAYVQQDDLFIGTLTAKEHLIFQALLRMDRHLTYKERLRRVDDILYELALVNCADTYIGISGRRKGLSAGEKRRLALASEVLTNPSVVFCDGPTVGLDAFMALSVVSVLKQMAAGGRTIVMTTHQPSLDMYAMFNRIIVMAEGRIAFQGKSIEALDFFSGLGMKCPMNSNPAEFYIEQLAVIPGQEEKCWRKIKLICDEYEKSGKAQLICETHTDGVTQDLPETAPTFERFKASWFSQLRVLIWRRQIIVRRERILTFLRLLQTVILSVMISLFYWGQEMTQEQIINILTILFFQNAMSVVTMFCEELPLFLRQHWNGMYRIDTYFLSKMLGEFPLFTFLPLLFICITHWTLGVYPSDYRVLFAIIISVLGGITALTIVTEACTKSTVICMQNGTSDLESLHFKNDAFHPLPSAQVPATSSDTDTDNLVVDPNMSPLSHSDHSRPVSPLPSCPESRQVSLKYVYLRPWSMHR